MKQVTLTRHAARRTKQRLGIPKRSAEHNAKKALEHGIRHSETRGSLNRYITSLYFNNRKANNIRILNQQVYIFQDSTLITVFPLPGKYRGTVDKIMRSRKETGKE